MHVEKLRERYFPNDKKNNGAAEYDVPNTYLCWALKSNVKVCEGTLRGYKLLCASATHQGEVHLQACMNKHFFNPTKYINYIAQITHNY